MLSQRWHRGERPVVFTDGDSQLRQMQMSLFPAATHILDWYHLTRQLTVLASVIDGQEMAKNCPTSCMTSCPS